MGNNLSSTNTRKQKKVKLPTKTKKRSSKVPNKVDGLRRLSLGSSSKKEKSSKLGLDSNKKRNRRRSSGTSNDSFRRLKAKITPGGTKKKSKKHASTTDQIMNKLNPNTTAETSRRKSIGNPFKKNTPPPKKNKIL